MNPWRRNRAGTRPAYKAKPFVRCNGIDDETPCPYPHASGIFGGDKRNLCTRCFKKFNEAEAESN